MLDRDALSRWIRPEHLDEEACSRYRDAMAAHPARMLVLHDLLVPEAADQLATFLAEGAVFNVEHGLYSTDGDVDPATWEAAPAEDRFFRFGKLSGQRPEAMLSDSMLTYLQWRTFVTEEPFRRFFESATGLALGPSDDFGCHEFNVGDFLMAHDDANRSRRLALVLYLTPGWEPSFGGALSMTAADGTTERTEATFNSMAVFDTTAGSSHRVERIEEAAAGTARRTFGGWFPDSP
jgi:hypothetical protein